MSVNINVALAIPLQVIAAIKNRADNTDTITGLNTALFNNCQAVVKAVDAIPYNIAPEQAQSRNRSSQEQYTIDVRTLAGNLLAFSLAATLLLASSSGRSGQPTAFRHVSRESFSPDASCSIPLAEMRMRKIHTGARLWLSGALGRARPFILYYVSVARKSRFCNGVRSFQKCN